MALSASGLFASVRMFSENPRSFISPSGMTSLGFVKSVLRLVSGLYDAVAPVGIFSSVIGLENVASGTSAFGIA